MTIEEAERTPTFMIRDAGTGLLRKVQRNSRKEGDAGHVRFIQLELDRRELLRPALPIDSGLIDKRNLLRASSS